MDQESARSDWTIIEIAARRVDNRVFIVERDETLHGAAEVTPAALDDDPDEDLPPDPPKLQMIYITPDSRGGGGPAAAVVAALKDTFPGLAHTGDLSPAGRRFVERYEIPREPHRRMVRDPASTRSVPRPDTPLTEEQAERLGQELLNWAQQHRPVTGH